MKTLTHLAVIALLMTSTGALATETAHKHQHDKAQPSHAQANQGFDCPMHPEVTGNKGDSCPKCGMDLEPINAAASKGQEASHKAHQHH
ncbi:MAG: heavy metal-binding domain-containing protein [Shewanella sp.]